jgi:hypothetical protein
MSLINILFSAEIQGYLDQGLDLLVKVLSWFLYVGQKLKPIRVDPLGLIFQNYLNTCKPKF